MELDGRGRRLALGGVVFLLVYLGVVTLVTMAANGWYPLLTDSFCGSLGDFHEGPVPQVCISFSAYWLRAVVHPPYVVAGAALGGVVAGAVAFRAAVRARLGP